MIRSRTTMWIAAAALALAGCGKKHDDQPAAAKIQHGKQAGKGTGGGDKTATGSKDGARGSGKVGGGQPTTAVAVANAGGEAALVQRGAYVAAVAACGVCHMPIGPTGPDMTRALAGGLEMHEKSPPFTWRASNITPDKDTGIGGWTDEQIATAIRQGVRPDGSRLAPVMPYRLYNRMTDDDVKALVAFLRSVPPVANKVERVDNSKLIAAMPPVPAPANAPVGTDAMARGTYLADLMHCVMCHTPMSPQGPDMTKAFAGGAEFELPPMFGTGSLFSANITSDPDTGLGKWSDADIIKAVRTATRPDGRPIQGPMQFYAAGWSQLTDEDAAALATFIRAIPPVKNQVPPSTFKPAGPPPGAGGPPGGAPPSRESSTGEPAKGT